MLLSLALIFLFGVILGTIFNKLKLPRLLGMLLIGIIFGPYALNLLDQKILLISSDLRQIALIIILTRAGLNLDINDLKKVGRPAFLMCFIPATLEIIGTILFAPILLNIKLIDAAILGAVIAAVSPAIVIPKMLKLIEKNYGKEKSIPQLIMTGASVDDIYVITLFTSFLGFASNGNFSPSVFLKVPTSILFGILIGYFCALILIILFKKLHIRDSLKVIIILSMSFLLVSLEKIMKGNITFSSLLSIMALGVTINSNYNILSKRLSLKYSKLWIASELLLFVLVGASVNIKYALGFSFSSIILILIVLIFRMFGVFLSLLKTSLNLKEKLFCMISYSPKATVQAALGGIPLSLGLSSGNTILIVSVLSILITAPLGSYLMDITYKKFLSI